MQYRSIRYGQALADCEAAASVGSKGDSYDNALAEALNSLYKAELIRNQGPWQDIDAASGRHRRVGPLVQHHPATLRHRDANPRRARSRLGTRPPPPGTITTGNHRNQINQPPQNPGLDTAVIAGAARSMPHTLRAVNASDEDAAALSMLTGFDLDLARQVNQSVNRIRGQSFTQTPPSPRGCGGALAGRTTPSWRPAAWPTPADLKRAGRTRIDARLKAHGCRRHTTWAGQIVSALEHQTVVVAGTDAAATVLPHLARQLIALHSQRADVATQAGDPGGHPLSCARS